MLRENEFKILVVGPFNSGKTTLIDTVCNGKIVKTEAPTYGLYKTVKKMTTVALDYGRFTLRSKKIHLFGTPGQERFSFMWHVLARGLDGFVVLIDGSDPQSLLKAKRIYELLASLYNVPHLILVNNKNGRVLVRKEDVKKILGTNAPIREASVVNKQDVEKILEELVKILNENR